MVGHGVPAVLASHTYLGMYVTTTELHYSMGGSKQSRCNRCVLVRMNAYLYASASRCNGCVLVRMNAYSYDGRIKTNCCIRCEGLVSVEDRCGFLLIPNRF